MKVVPPHQGEPQGWYVEFTGRWQAYLLAQAELGVALGGVAALQQGHGDVASSSRADLA